MSKRIDGLVFKSMVTQAAFSMQKHCQKANELNVFPVPDGDTGTNMSLTLKFAKEALDKLVEPSLEEAAETTASALLRGARGNSGVILSLLFRGIAKKLKERESAGGSDLAVALREGVDTAYKAVMKPAEGTILTVSRCAAQRAVELCQTDPDLSVEKVLNGMVEEAEQALTQTQVQNPVLKKAGVVDAGGYGLLEILRGMQDAFLGRPLEDTLSDSKNEPKTICREEKTESNADIPFIYCTEFIAQRRDKARSLERLQALLSKMGDSLVVVEDEDIIKVHVHTNNPDRVLTQGLRFGPLLTIKVENMRQQHTAKLVGEISSDVKKSSISPERTFGFVSVVAGDGVASLFTDDLGVDQVVSGGQSMNPSTNDILEAVNVIPAYTVYVLPNNKNIIMAAQQVIPLVTDKKVVVLPTESIPQGISAMLSFDPDATEEQNTQAMTEALSCVHSGAITYAARNSEYDGKKIREGEYLALSENKLCVNTRRLSDAVKKLAREMTRKVGGSYLTILYGADMTESDAKLVEEAFLKECPQLETTIIRGGQPVYYFIISVE